MAEKACEYGQVKNLEVLSIAGGKSLFIESLNDVSGDVVNEKSIIQAFDIYGTVKRVKILPFQNSHTFDDVFVYFENNASGQMV
ncbi:MAG: hypothetical protein EZS28_037500 [Streblomastix strix]|uniref:RRM domain-containing protein n=1 Tax=Streblomastix strix TaxID=222440 RepID=A0A5J4U9Y6_9EUKA|nr:MAG: hypothetical protein EZS28_037500 [Streblomastix strix]